MTHQTNTTDFPKLTTNELLTGIWPMPPGTHQPHNWIFMLCEDDERDYFRILSCWGEDWRVSSEVQSVETFSDHWRATTKTGSDYLLMAGRNQPTQSAINFASRIVKHWRESDPQEFTTK